MYEKTKVFFITSSIFLLILLSSVLIPSFYFFSPILISCSSEKEKYPEPVDLPPPECPKPHFSVLSGGKILVEKNWGYKHGYPVLGNIVGYLVDLTSETVSPVVCDLFPSFFDNINEYADELLPEDISGKIFLRKGEVYVVFVADRTKEIFLEIYNLLVEKGLVEGGKTDFSDIINVIKDIYNKVKFPSEYPYGTFFAKVSEVEIQNPFLKKCKSGGLSRLLLPCQEKIKIKKIEVISSYDLSYDNYFDIRDIDVWGDSLILITRAGDVFLYRKGVDCYVNNLLAYYKCQAGKMFGDPMYDIQAYEPPALIGENEIAVGNKIFKVLNGRVITTEIDIKPNPLIHVNPFFEINPGVVPYTSGVNYIGVKDGRYYVVNRREKRYYPLSADISKGISFAEDKEGNLYAQIIEDDNCIATIFKVVNGTFIPYVKINLCEEKIMEKNGKEKEINS